jgi:hypothetical protein
MSLEENSMQYLLIIFMGLFALAGSATAAEPATVFKRNAFMDGSWGNPIGVINGSTDNLTECIWLITYRNDQVKELVPNMYPLLWCELGSFGKDAVHAVPKNY